MKKFLFLIVLSVFSISLFLASVSWVNARVSVNGYYKSNGTYVQPYYRSSPNVYKYDNYSYKSYQPTYNNSYYNRTYNYNSPLYTPDYSYRSYRRSW